MQYFTEQASTHREAIDKVRYKYGERAKILTHRTIKMGGFFGMFAREGIEVTGYLANEPPKKRNLNLEEEKKKILDTVKNDQTLQMVLQEVKSLREKLDSQEQGSTKHEEIESIEKIQEFLLSNVFSNSFTNTMIQRLKTELTYEELDDYTYVQKKVVEWLGESIKIYKIREREKPHIFILLGPTGVGKTTTVAKLAAMYSIGEFGTNEMDVRIITIDNYRIAAKQQIETYGNIMQIPVECVETYQDLKKYIALYEDVDFIFVDTIGKSPRDFVKLAEMKELLEGCGKSASSHLTLSATTKPKDVKEILKQFEPFDYQSIIITKLDETNSIGSLLSTILEKQKKVSFLTDGQSVPYDIQKASVVRLLMGLDDIKINRTELEEKFAVT